MGNEGELTSAHDDHVILVEVVIAVDAPADTPQVFNDLWALGFCADLEDLQ